MIYQDAYETFRKQFMSSRQRTDSKHVDQLAKSKSKELPIEVIRDVHKALQPSLKESKTHPNLIVLVCKHSERIEGRVLSDLMQTLRLGLGRDIKFVVLLFQSSGCSLNSSICPFVHLFIFVALF